MKYAVILNPNDLSAAAFNTLKDRGLTTDSRESIRKSLDGSKGIIKWSGDRPAGISNLVFIVFEGTQEEMLNYLSVNSSDWNLSEP